MSSFNSELSAKLSELGSRLVDLLESVKAATAEADAIKAQLKDVLPDGTHVLGDAVCDIRTQNSTRLDKQALASFFNIPLTELEQFEKVTSCRQLSAKRVSITTKKAS